MDCGAPWYVFWCIKMQVVCVFDLRGRGGTCLMYKDTGGVFWVFFHCVASRYVSDVNKYLRLVRSLQARI